MDTQETKNEYYLHSLLSSKHIKGFAYSSLDNEKFNKINENYKPFVSIMIPAHNEEYVIEETINNVLNLNYPNFEIIVIDDRSEDNTANVIKNLEAKHDKVIALIRDKDAFPGKSAVLNDALKIAKGEAILVFDADATMESNFLANLIPKLEPADVGAVQARKVIRNKDFNFLTRCQNNEYTMDSHFQVGRDAIKGAVELRGNGELIKRTALEDIGGWNNYTITDDLDMSTRLHINGWDIRFCIDTCVYEEGIVYWKPLFRQRRRWLEGTIRRYLEYFWEAINSKKMSLRAQFDMAVYIAEFVLPIWFVMEVVFRTIKLFTDQFYPNSVNNIILSSVVIAGAVAVGFFSAIRYALRRYDNLARIDAIKQAIETAVYMWLIWFPVMLFIFGKILLREKDMNWGKTAHGLVLEEEQSIS